MKISRSSITIILSIIIGIAVLALQKPVSNALTMAHYKAAYENSTNFKISNTWKLPNQLDEISGLTWLENNTFACVQDEDGLIFIYDVKQGKILEKIKFAGPGDYEGIAVDDTNAYVMRSDGMVYDIKNYRSENREVSTFQTLFSEKNNMESLTLDVRNKRLLTAPKDKDLEDETIKCIYQIQLDSKTTNTTPVVAIDLKNEKLKAFQHNKIYKTFNPSDIAIHPKTKDIYVLEGKDPKLLVLNSKGDLLKVHKLNEHQFQQPEGLTFNNEGQLFISNEANGKSANILEVELR